MARRYLVFLSVLAICGEVSAQNAPKKWTAPRTPWGDFELQGWFTDLQEDGAPLERPDQFAGRQLDEIKGEELAAIKRDTQKRTNTTFQGPLQANHRRWLSVEGWGAAGQWPGSYVSRRQEAVRRIFGHRGPR